MKPTRLIVLIVLTFALCVTAGAFAQTVVDTKVKAGLVIGKTDHSVVLKMDDGVTREIEVSPGRTALVDGKEIGLADLKIGTTLSATLHTVAKPVEVKTTRIRQGEVVKAQGSTLVYKENGKLFTKTVPTGYRFNVEGRGETVLNDLTPGMKLTATIVETTTHMETETERAGAVTGKAPAQAAPVAIVPPTAAVPAPLAPETKVVARAETPAPAPTAAPAPATTTSAAPEKPAEAPVAKAETPVPETPAGSSRTTMIVIGLIVLVLVIVLVVRGGSKKS